MVVRQHIKIEQLADVYEFIDKAKEVEGDVIISKGKFSVDAKSLIGVMSINISDMVTIEYPFEDECFNTFIQKFVV